MFARDIFDIDHKYEILLRGLIECYAVLNYVVFLIVCLEIRFK
jgi:hypothetical protein